MTRDEVVTIATNVIGQETGRRFDRIDPGTKLVDLGIDSLDVLRLALAFERLFKINIATADLRQIQTFGDIIAGIERKLVS